LTGVDVAVGGAAAVLVRVFPLLATALLLGLLPIGRGYDPAGSAALFVLTAAAVLLTYGISLWASLLLQRPGERTAATLAVCIAFGALLEVGMRLSTSSGDGGARSARDLLAAASATAGIGLLLAGSFAALFRRVVRA
jgi:hypothetical protein